MSDFRQRVIEEAHQLEEKVVKLKDFLASSTSWSIPMIDRNLLQEQYMSMIDYLDILNMRIDRFNAAPN